MSHEIAWKVYWTLHKIGLPLVSAVLIARELADPDFECMAEAWAAQYLTREA